MSIPPGGRGAFGDWLRTEREKRYKTQDVARAAYRKLAGLTINPSEYAQWEAGSRVPRPDNPKRIALYAFYGSREQEEPSPEPQSELSLLAAAINRQAEAIEALVSRLDDLAMGQKVLAEEVGSIVDPARARQRLAAAQSEMPPAPTPNGSGGG